MVTTEDTPGRQEVKVMVRTPLPGMWKVMVSAPAAFCAAVMASRKLQCDELQVPSSVSDVVLTTKVAAEASPVLAAVAFES